MKRPFVLIVLAPAVADDRIPVALEALGIVYNGLAAAPGSPAPPVAPSVAPGPRPPTPGLCKGFGTLLPILNATWGKQDSWHSADFEHFGDNAVWAFKLVVPVGTPTSTMAGSFTIAEFLGPNTPRQLTISRQACDFRPRDFTGVNGPLAICQDGTSCQISYAVQMPQVFGGVAGLAAGQTYYVNARNWSNFPLPPAYDCGQTTCNAIMNHQPATP
jgi:hypothetical protein